MIQPVKITRYKVAIPALFDFVAGSAKVNGQPASPSFESGLLTFELARTLARGRVGGAGVLRKGAVAWSFFEK